MEVESLAVVASASTGAETEQPARRFDPSLLDKSLDDLIKANRAERRSKAKTAGKNKAKPQNGGVKKISLQELRAKQNRNGNDNKNANNSKKAATNNTPKNNNNNRTQKIPRNTPGIRQPWEKPVTLPRAPLPEQPLKISIRNELADQRPSSSHSMDWSSTSRYEPRDRVEDRKEYRMGSRYSTQPMNIDYDLGRRY